MTVRTIVTLPDPKQKGDATIAVGQPARIALVRPAEDGKYRVEVVLK